MRQCSGMKKLIIIIVIALALPLAGYAQSSGRPVPGAQISLLINEYKYYDGFEAVKLGRLATGALKTLIRSGAAIENDADLKDALKMMKGIKKLTVVDYSDCAPQVRQGFSQKMGRLLDGADMLMEVKDGSDILRMYGVVDDKASKVKNFILYSPEDCMFLCLFGSISLDPVLSMASRHNEL